MCLLFFCVMYGFPADGRAAGVYGRPEPHRPSG